MTLTTTPGSATADSYASLADALAYHSAKGNPAWAASTDGLREPALRRATAWVDATYRARWQNIGYPVYPRVQALDWPMSGITDPYGYAVNHLTIPAEIIAATCEAALRELVEPGALMPDVTLSDATVLTRVGPLSFTPLAGGSGVSAQKPVLTVVDGIIDRLLGARSRNVIEVVRA